MFNLLNVFSRRKTFDLTAIGDEWIVRPLTHDGIDGTLHVRQLPAGLRREDFPLVAMAWVDASLDAEDVATRTRAVQQALEDASACLLVLVHAMPDRVTWYAYAAQQKAIDTALFLLDDPAVHWGINDDPGWTEYTHARDLVGA